MLDSRLTESKMIITLWMKYFLGLNTFETLINKGFKGDCTKLDFMDSGKR